MHKYFISFSSLNISILEIKLLAPHSEDRKMRESRISKMFISQKKQAYSEGY